VIWVVVCLEKEDKKKKAKAGCVEGDRITQTERTSTADQEM